MKKGIVFEALYASGIKKMEDVKAQNQGNKTILVAEDDEFNFLLIKTVLLLNGYNVVHARNGKEAVGLFQNGNDVDIVLMDLQMPVMDGFTAMQEIRKLDKHVPLIVQTTFNMNDMRDKAFRLGCNDFITKPIEPEVLLNKIGKYLFKSSS